MMNTNTTNNRKRVIVAATKRKAQTDETIMTTTTKLTPTTITKTTRNKTCKVRVLSVTVVLFLFILFVMNNRSNKLEALFNKVDADATNIKNSSADIIEQQLQQSKITQTQDATSNNSSNSSFINFNNNTNTNLSFNNYQDNNHQNNNHTRRNRNSQIVILAGPHKTASTTMQNFLVTLAGQTISLKGQQKFENKGQRQKNNVDYYQVPHPQNQEWVWPIGYSEGLNEPLELAGIKVMRHSSKFYAPLVAWLTGRRKRFFVERKIPNQQNAILTYYRNLFQKVWNMDDNNNNNADNNDDDDKQHQQQHDNMKNNKNSIELTPPLPPPISSTSWKKIVFGAEAFDALVKDLLDNKSDQLKGENLYISPSAGHILDLLLSLMPWDDNDNNNDNDNDTDNDNVFKNRKKNISNTNSSSNHKNSNSNKQRQRRPSFRLDDIEVVINYRTPRISHLISIWHQMGHKRTLQQFVSETRERFMLNSLGLALQFVHHGIFTTIIDMKGVAEKEEHEREQQQQEQEQEKREGKDNNDIHNNNSKKLIEIGGLQGILSCDVLKSNMCDENGKLIMTMTENDNGNTIKLIEDKQKKEDTNDRNLTDLQLYQIDEVMNEYDCYVWKYLRTYQTQGKIRILYPSKSNSATIFNNTFLCGQQGGEGGGGGLYDERKQISEESMLQKFKEIASL